MATETSTEVVTTTVTEEQNAVMQAPKEDKAISLEGVAKEKIPYYKAISKVLKEDDITTVIDYGGDLHKAMGGFATDLLNKQIAAGSDNETAKLVADLYMELKAVDIEDFEDQNAFKRLIAKIPFLKSFVMSYDKLKSKYNTIQKNVDGIVERLEAAKHIALRDNNQLQQQLENNVDYVKQLEDIIIAGKLKCKELQNKIMLMESGRLDGTELQLHDLKDYLGALEKRITDLVLLRYTFKQSLVQIRIIQNTNMMDIMNTETQIKMAIPVWINQLCVAVALSNQKKSIAMKNMMSDATNKMITKNAEMIKQQSVEVVKQTQRTVVDVESLKKATADILATVEGVQKAQKEGAEKRAAAEAEVKRLEEQMGAAADNMRRSANRIITSELQNLEIE
jgi:uncharacterized protein YaaN involved in tellurite resistance